MPREKTDRAWFSRPLSHLVRKQSGSILSIPEPARGPYYENTKLNHLCIRPTKYTEHAVQYTDQQHVTSCSFQCLNGMCMSHVLCWNPIHRHNYVIKPAYKYKHQLKQSPVKFTSQRSNWQKMCISRNTGSEERGMTVVDLILKRMVRPTCCMKHINRLSST